MADEQDIEREAVQKQQNKSELERTAAARLNGGPQLKRNEKNKFLGEFRERVLIALTYSQVEELGTYQEVLEAIRDQEAVKLIINAKVDLQKATEYVKLADENDLSFKKTGAAGLTSDIALVVVSDHAVNRDDIYIKNRHDKLAEKDIPEELIQARGKKVCSSCYQLIEKRAPEELDNYQSLNWFDKLLGEKCPVNHN